MMTYNQFSVRYMYDYDGNGVLDQNDFECLAVRNTILEGKGDWDPIKYEKNKNVMINLWQQICEIADFDKNNEVDTEEFMKGVETACKGKSYEQLPEAFKFFIEAQFRTIDVDGNYPHIHDEWIQSFPKATDPSVSRSSATIALAVWLTLM